MKLYYIALCLFLTLFFSRQITHVICFGRYRNRKCKKMVYYSTYGFWTLFFLTLCLMMGSAAGVDHTFDYGMKSLELYSGNRNYFEGDTIYEKEDYKHNGDFILEYYVKKKADIEMVSKQIVEENVFIYRAYNLSDINVRWQFDDLLYVCGKEEVYAIIKVEKQGFLRKLSFRWNQEKLNHNIGG